MTKCVSDQVIALKRAGLSNNNRVMKELQSLPEYLLSTPESCKAKEKNSMGHEEN